MDQTTPLDTVVVKSANARADDELGLIYLAVAQLAKQIADLTAECTASANGLVDRVDALERNLQQVRQGVPLT